MRSYSYTVVAKENVTIPLGIFEVCKISATETIIDSSGDRYVTTGTMRYVPAVGSSIKKTVEENVCHEDVLIGTLKITGELMGTTAEGPQGKELQKLV